MPDWMDRLDKLTSLKDKGAITEKEFQAEKQSILASRNHQSSSLELSKIGSYRILSKIGEGGMGTVYQAIHQTAGIAERQGGEVAIKVMHAQYAQNPDLRARFEREATVCLKLDHPGIVRVYDLLEDQGQLGLVMEMVDGKPLSVIIGEEVGPIPWDTATGLFFQLLDAVDYAHNNGVVHRDIKPENVMVTEDQKIKILDFGIAKDLSAGKTKTGTGMGTVSYMAPEQYTDAKTVDHRADIYALGMTLYEMLAGRLPWESGETEYAIQKQKEAQSLPPPTDFYPYIPEHVVAAIQQSIAKDIASRTNSCSNFTDLLYTTNIENQQSDETTPVQTEQNSDVRKNLTHQENESSNETAVSIEDVPQIETEHQNNTGHESLETMQVQEEQPPTVSNNSETQVKKNQVFAARNQPPTSSTSEARQKRVVTTSSRISSLTNKLPQKKLLFWIRECIVLVTLLYWLVTITPLNRYPAGDGPHIVGTAGRLAQQLQDLDFGWFVLCFSSLLGPHPPFAYIPFTIGELLFNGQHWSHLFAGALVLWFVWDALRRMNAGIIGFIWVFAGAPIWLQAENAGIDLLAAATVIQSISHLYASNKLQIRSHTFWWGFWIGCAFMTKYTAPMFLWGPCVVAGIWALKYNRLSRIIVGIAAFLIVAFPWWSTHAMQVYGYVVASGNADSGLLTNKAIIESPWYAKENLMWYPAAIADSLGWAGFFCLILFAFLPRKKFQLQAIILSSAVGGWFMLNAQKQRQDRYIIPIYPVLSAGIGSHPIGLLTLPIIIQTLQETKRIYTAVGSHPVQRNYTHEIETSGQRWPTPSDAYWPISQNPEPWGIDSILEKVRKYTGSDYGTVGFLLDEQGGAPGYGLILSRAISLGYRWHIATVMIAQPRGNMQADKNRPLASIFVGPFLFGEWPSREFNVMLSMVSHNDPQREKWLQSINMTVVEEWPLPQGRVGKIWIKEDSNQDN
jgi:serine/threonine protein kinase